MITMISPLSRFRFYNLIIIAFLLFSCKKEPVKSHSNILIKKEIETSKGPYQASNTIYWDLIHTKLEVSFDFQKQHLLGKATLRLKPQFYPQNKIILDAKGFDIQSIYLINNEKINRYTYDSSHITILLNKTYSRIDTIQLFIQYTAKPNDLPKEGSEVITEEKGLYFIDPLGNDPFKPTQIWTQGETQSSSCWFPTIDSPNQRSTQEMFITADKKYQVISNGELVYKTDLPDGNTTWYWKMDQSHAPYLFMMAVGEFSKIRDDWKGKEVSYYVDPEFEPYARAIFGKTPQMIEFFSNKLNYPYPWPKYSQIVVHDFVSGAMENTSASIFMEDLQVDNRFLVDKNWESIISHELAHHWFGDLVTCESWANLPLNESFANFSEIAWIGHEHGFDEEILHTQEDLSGYLNEAETRQDPLIRYHYLDIEEMFDRHSYNKGGLVLNLLRNAVGEDAFYSSLNRYLTQNAYSPVEIDKLRIAFEEVTGEDMHWFFDTWFMKPGHAVLKANHFSNSDNKVAIKIEQKQDSVRGTIYRLPLQVDYKIKNDTTLYSQRVWINQYEQTIILPIDYNQLNYLVLDSKHVLVGTLEHEKSRDLLISQLINGTDYLIRLHALQSLLNSNSAKENPYQSHPENADYLMLGLNDSFHAVRDFAIREFSKHPVPGRESVFLDKLVEMAINEPNGEIRAGAIQLISSFNNERFIDNYKKGIDAPSYHVAGACLSALLAAQNQETINRLAEFEKINNLNIIIPLALYFIQNRDISRYNWFEEKMEKANDQTLYNFMNSFTKYLLLLNREERIQGGKILKQISETNSHQIIRKNATTYYQIIEKSLKQ